MNILTARNKLLAESGFKPNQTRCTTSTGRMLQNRPLIWADTGVCDSVVDAILLGIPLPKVYALEDASGKYTIISNAEIVSTICNVLGDLSLNEERELLRKFASVEVDFVYFPHTMTSKQVASVVHRLIAPVECNASFSVSKAKALAEEALLKSLKEGDSVKLSSRKHKSFAAPTTIHGAVFMPFDEELARVEVLDPSDNALYMITQNDIFWKIDMA